MHASRLERLHDSGNLDGEGDVLAADSEVTGAVEGLLGLSYDHFTTCVALPQGEFAQFLHAKASDRQDILSSLLGYQLYEQLQSRANSLARDRQARGKVLEETLATYVDATEQQVSKLGSRASQLEQLQSWLSNTGLVHLADTANAVTDTSGRLTELTTHQQVLAGFEVPPDVVSIDGQLTFATSVLAEAAKKYQAASDAESQAAQKVRAFRPRHELLAVRQHWEELARADADLPDVETAGSKAEVAHIRAEEATAQAEQTAEQSRVASEKAAASADQALEAVKAVSGQVAALAGIAIPADLGELTAALAALRTRQQELQAETDAAEYAYATASAVLQSAPNEAALSTGRQLSAAIHDALAIDLASWDQRDETADVLAAADAAAVSAAATLKAARTGLEEARLADGAGALRIHLVTGQPCPVCEQPVNAIPAGHNTSHVAAAEQKLNSAQSSSDQATKKHADLDRKYQATIATRAATLRHVDTERVSLCTALRDVRATDDQPRRRRPVLTRRRF
jgi:exonuclease SbcC